MKLIDNLFKQIINIAESYSNIYLIICLAEYESLQLNLY